MQIGEAAKTSGVSAKMIRHDEAIGLIPAAARRDSNYRDYSQKEVHQLGFIRRARDLGFSIDRSATCFACRPTARAQVRKSSCWRSIISQSWTIKSCGFRRCATRSTRWPSLAMAANGRIVRSSATSREVSTYRSLNSGRLLDNSKAR